MRGLVLCEGVWLRLPFRCEGSFYCSAQFDQGGSTTRRGTHLFWVQGPGPGNCVPSPLSSTGHPGPSASSQHCPYKSLPHSRLGTPPLPVHARPTFHPFTSHLPPPPPSPHPSQSPCTWTSLPRPRRLRLFSILLSKTRTITARLHPSRFSFIIFALESCPILTFPCPYFFAPLLPDSTNAALTPSQGLSISPSCSRLTLLLSEFVCVILKTQTHHCGFLCSHWENTPADFRRSAVRHSRYPVARVLPSRSTFGLVCFAPPSTATQVWDQSTSPSGGVFNPTVGIISSQASTRTHTTTCQAIDSCPSADDLDILRTISLGRPLMARAFH